MDQYCKVMKEHLAKGYIEELAISNEGGKVTVEDVNEPCRDNTRPTRKAARDARDIIHVQLIDYQQD